MDVSLDLVAGAFLKSHLSACLSADFHKNLCHGKYQNPIYVSFLFVEKYLWAIHELTFVYCQNNLEIMALLNSTFLLPKIMDLHGLCSSIAPLPSLHFPLMEQHLVGR
jgi:hypothetical protein